MVLIWFAFALLVMGLNTIRICCTIIICIPWYILFHYLNLQKLTNKYYIYVFCVSFFMVVVESWCVSPLKRYCISVLFVWWKSTITCNHMQNSQINSLAQIKRMSYFCFPVHQMLSSVRENDRITPPGWMNTV